MDWWREEELMVLAGEADMEIMATGGKEAASGE